MRVFAFVNRRIMMAAGSVCGAWQGSGHMTFHYVNRVPASGSAL